MVELGFEPRSPGPEPVLLSSRTWSLTHLCSTPNKFSASSPTWACSGHCHCCPLSGPGSMPGDGDGSVRPGFLSPRRTLLWSLPALDWAPATLMWLLLPAGHLACTWRGGHLSLSPPAYPRPLCCFSAAAQEPNIFQILSSHLGSALGRAHEQGLKAAPGRSRKPWHQPALEGKRTGPMFITAAAESFRLASGATLSPLSAPPSAPAPPSLPLSSI